MLPYLYGHFGNPSSAHIYGARARQAVENARAQLAQLLGCAPGEIVFTSGGSEANNMAVKGVAEAYRSGGRHIIRSAVEHPAVSEPCDFLVARGYRVTVLPVDEYGRVDPRSVARAIAPDTILISIIHANNEVGTLQPVAEIAAVAHEHGVIFHTDAAQSVGKIPVDVRRLGVDLLSIAGHKFYAPKGVGALYVRSGVKLAKFMHGAEHEADRRAGTENVLEIVGLGQAAAVASEELEARTGHMLAMRERLWRGLQEAFTEPEQIRRNGHPEEALPNTLSVSFRALEANTLVDEISAQVAVSAGAACHADSIHLSPVLQAMGIPLEYAMGTVRFSVGKMTSAQEIDRAVKVVGDAARRLQPDATSPYKPVEHVEPVRLTQFTHGLGCACKMRPQALEKILAALPAAQDPAVLVDQSRSDDAAVYRLREDLAVVQTVDFFTPVVDDPYDFGAVSAANSLSDIYAMGGKPLFALNIVGFPTQRLPLEVLESILQGALEKAAEAGVSVLGGHSIEDTEPKYGMVVTGVIHPERVVTNSAARSGDQLVLTKPIGTGIVTTAAKRGLVDMSALEKAVRWMAALNRDAAQVMVEVGASACTDVTGFGLLGHLWEMTSGSGVNAQIFAGSVPFLEGVPGLIAANIVPGGTRDNLAFVEPHITWEEEVSQTQKLLLADAQTSGGLLIAVPEDRLPSLLEALLGNGIQAAHIGEFTGAGPGRITVLP
jgi:selenium donor protein